MEYKTIAEILDKAALDATAVEQISLIHPINISEYISLIMSSKYIRKRRGPRIDPCETPNNFCYHVEVFRLLPAAVFNHLSQI